MGDLREFWEKETVSRADFADWFSWFGVDGAQAIVYMRFLQGPDARVRFAEAILPEGYFIEEERR